MQQKIRLLICVLYYTVAVVAQTPTTEVWVNPIGPDIGTALKSAIGSFAGTGGMARIACGSYTTAVGNITINYPNISIAGQNSNCVSITYTGTSDFMRVQMKPFTIVQGAK